MENRKLVKLIVYLIGLIIFIVPIFVFGYSDTTTHPALTDEVVDLFNSEYQNLRISDADKEFIKKGSVEEDIPPRWMQHFFDPVYNRGLILGTEWEKSKDWSQDTVAQAEYDPIFTASLGTITRKLFSSKTDYSWDRAVYEYVWGDKQKGLEALGHTLHLLEDVTVPDHTRNDVHLPFLNQESFYEDWTAQFNSGNFNLADKLINKNEKPPIYSDLNRYFDNNAIYSNNNFFSRDTTPDKENKYSQPLIIKEGKEILKNGEYIIFGYTKISDKEFKVVARSGESSWVETIRGDKNYFINDTDHLILSDYWNILSEQAVLSGVGVVKLFFDDIEKEKNSKVLLSKNTSFFGKLIAGIIETGSKIQSAALSLWNKLASGEQTGIISQSLAPSPPPVVSPPPTLNVDDITISDVVNSAESAEVGPSQVPPSPAITENGSPYIPPPPPSPPPPIPPPPQIVEHPVSNNQNPQGFIPSLPYPGFGGGGVAAPPPSGSSPTPPTPPAPPSDTTPPNSPIITSPNNFSQTFTSATIIFLGIGEAQSMISNDFNNSTTTADSAGIWSLNLNFNQGSTTIKFFSQDVAGNISSSTNVSLFIDSTAPAIDSFSISECGSSLSTDGCLLATTTIHLLWQSSASDLDYFELIQNGATSNITATSTTVVLQDNSTNAFSIKVKDKTGNWSLSQTVTAEISTMPVVINEIAWGGTPGHPNDEWIELYNRTSRTINLNNWILYSQTDFKPYINLTGSISPKGYYLIERTDDNTVSDVSADWKGSFGSSEDEGGDLNSFGEVLVLSYAPPVGGQASTTIDQTVLNFNGWWPEGTETGRTMERYNPDIAGNIASNWGSNSMIIRNGKTAGPEFWDINGTPKARNGVNYLIVKTGSNLVSDLTITKSKSPYLVESTGFTINTGITLTIEPGVVIKFYGGHVRVEGKIIANGTAGEQIVFTSFNDDEYGGDLDNAVITPVAGSWYGVEILSTGSIFDNTIFRYGGKWYSGMGNTQANLSVKDFPVAIANSIFEYSKVFGLKLTNSNSTVSGSIFRNNNYVGEGGATGVLVEAGSDVLIQSSSFSDNRTGIYYSNSPIKLQNVRFEDNVWGLSADALSASMPISVSSVEFFGSGATTTPGGLW